MRNNTHNFASLKQSLCCACNHVLLKNLISGLLGNWVLSGTSTEASTTDSPLTKHHHTQCHHHQQAMRIGTSYTNA